MQGLGNRVQEGLLGQVRNYGIVDLKQAAVLLFTLTERRFRLHSHRAVFRKRHGRLRLLRPRNKKKRRYAAGSKCWEYASAKDLGYYPVHDAPFRCARGSYYPVTKKRIRGIPKASNGRCRSAFLAPSGILQSSSLRFEEQRDRV